MIDEKIEKLWERVKDKQIEMRNGDITVSGTSENHVKDFKKVFEGEDPQTADDKFNLMLENIDNLPEIQQELERLFGEIKNKIWEEALGSVEKGSIEDKIESIIKCRGAGIKGKHFEIIKKELRGQIKKAGVNVVNDAIKKLERRYSKKAVNSAVNGKKYSLIRGRRGESNPRRLIQAQAAVNVNKSNQRNSQSR